MKKKKIIATISAVVMAVGLTLAGVTAITTYADGVEGGANATSTPGTETPGTETPETPVDPGTETPETPVDPGTETPETPVDPGTETPETPVDPGTETPETPVDPGTETPETPVDPGTETPETPVDPGRTPSKVVTVDEVKKDTVTVIQEAAGTKVVITTEAVLASGTGSFEVKVGTIKLDIPAAILALGVGDVTIDTTVVPATATLKKLEAVPKLFELSLKDSAGNVISDFKGSKIDVTLELQETDFKGLDKSKLKVFYWNDGKAEQWFDTKINGTNVTFTTGHFSTFGIGEYSSSTASGIKTGDASNTTLVVASLVGSLVLLSAVGGAYVINKRKKVNN